MDLNQKITLAETIGKHLAAHAPAIWPGFTPFPFTLYDGNHRAASGDGWPDEYKPVRAGIWAAEGADPLLMGCTSVMYHGRLTAIWDTRMWADEPDEEEAAAGMAHEMFHCFQRERLNIPWANELLLPQYPHTARSVALLAEENDALARMVTEPALLRDCLEKIAGLRRLRECEIGAEYMEYDKRIESLEGTAVYAEIRMKAILRGVTPFEAAVSYLKPLARDGGILNIYRHRCYIAGAVFCLAADALCPGWQEKWPCDEIPIYDWLSGQLKLTGETERILSASALAAAETLVSDYRRENGRRVAEFMNQPLARIDGAELINFDPMNIICSDNRCLHVRGRVRAGGNEYLLEFPFITEYGGDILDVKRLYVPKEKEAMFGAAHD